jgi:hypothetical protein
MVLSLSTGLTKDGENVSGKITIPEVAHDTEEDEYVVRSLNSNLHQQRVVANTSAIVRHRGLL